MKLNQTHNKLTAAMILAGGLMFAGNTHATTVLINEDFEAASPGTSGWVYSQYATTANYSNSPHSGVTSGGNSYGWAPGGTSAPPNMTTASFDLTAGESTILFDGWLAAYTANDDHVRFEAEFFDAIGGGGSSLGNVVLADGLDFTNVTEFVDAAGVLTAGNGGADNFNWKHYVSSNAIPAGALSVNLNYIGDATANNGNDAYVDNIVISTAVPEPSTTALFGLSALGLLTRRRR